MGWECGDTFIIVTSNHILSIAYNDVVVPSSWYLGIRLSGPTCVLGVPMGPNMHITLWLSLARPSNSILQTLGFGIPVIFCKPRVAVIPSFPPSIFWCHSLGARNFLCLLPSRPNKSTLQTTRVQHPCDVLHTLRPCHPVFPPSIFQYTCCCAYIWLGLSRQQYTAKQNQKPSC